MSYDPVTGERTGGPEPTAPKGRAERLETFREVHTEQEKSADLARLNRLLVEEKRGLEDYDRFIAETTDPLLKTLLQDIRRDEKRHVESIGTFLIAETARQSAEIKPYSKKEKELVEREVDRVAKKYRIPKESLLIDIADEMAQKHFYIGAPFTEQWYIDFIERRAKFSLSRY